MKKFFPLFIFILITFVFFWQFFSKGLLPLPADTIVGLYHPWRDYYEKEYPRGVPFKNFLITDPVRQQYVWRKIAIEQMKQIQLPIWNPYNFSGTPLLANFQSAVFYPGNLLFFLLPFNFAWTILVILQPLLTGLFLYFYLRNLKIDPLASLTGGLSWAFGGFNIAWLEWNTIGHVALWLPLILLSIDKILVEKRSRWSLVFLLSLCSSFFAGHLQIFFYVALFSFIYFFFRWFQYGKSLKVLLLTTFYLLLATLITSVQWVSTLQFILNSYRNFDLPSWQASSWFLPWQNLVQFLAPDFFGNPATLNYWGQWNYGEFVGYIGILPLLIALFAVFWRRDRKTWFAILAVIISLAFMLPTPLAKLPYQLNIPFLSTLQPTRLMVIVDFCLAILSALGIDWLVKHLNDSNHLSKIYKTFLSLGLVFGGLWFIILNESKWFAINSTNLSVAQRNLILPTVLFLLSVLILILLYLSRQKRFSTTIIYIIVVGLVGFDLLRFGWKFTPFSPVKYLFPKTKVIEFLQNQPKPFRIMTTDNKILPPNFSAYYGLEDVAGYDPLYLKSYGDLMAAWYRNKPDFTPFSFNRLLTPQDYSSPIADLLNVKYVLSLKDENSPKLKLVFQEGQTRVYENTHVLPSSNFFQKIRNTKDYRKIIEEVFQN